MADRHFVALAVLPGLGQAVLMSYVVGSPFVLQVGYGLSTSEFALVFAVNAIYLPLVEEPGLQLRFGADYEAYRAAVPRWVPRLRPWQPAD